MFGNPLPFTPEGRKVTQRRVDGIKNGTPYLNASAYCIPTGQFWQFDLNMPFQIFQSKDRIELLFEEYHGLMHDLAGSGQGAARGLHGSLGRSLGWRHAGGGNQRVQGRPVADAHGTSASKDAKLTQRIRKVKTGDKWYLEMIYTLDDPTYYTQPWSFARRYAWHPDMALFREYNCELQTGAKDGVDPSLVPEPTN